MKTVKQEGKTGIMHINGNLPASLALVNEKLELAIKKAAYKYMLQEEEVREIVHSN